MQVNILWIQLIKWYRNSTVIEIINSVYSNMQDSCNLQLKHLVREHKKHWSKVAVFPSINF